MYGYDGLPMLQVAPPSPDFIPAPKEPQTPPAPQDKDEYEPVFIQPHDLDFVPGPIYPEYIPLEDEHIPPAEEQPLPPVGSPTDKSPGYVAELDPEEDPKEYEDDEIENGPVDYPIYRGDDGDDDDGDSSRDDADDEDEDEEDEEHLAPADSTVVIPTDELVSSPEGTEPVIPPPSTDTATTGARITAPSMRLERVLRLGQLEAKDPAETVPEIAPMTVGDVNTRVTELVELHEHDTQDLYALLEDAHDNRTRISQRVVVDSQRVDLLMEDRIAHQETIQIMEDEAYMQQTKIAELRETDRRRQAQMAETLRVMGDMRREMGDMQAELLALQIMAPVTRQGPSTLPNSTNPNNMTPESVQAMIDQAILRNSTNRDGSHSSHEDNRRNVQTTRPCFYADFMKCQPLNFKGTEGVVGLTRWIEKMETVFQISGCAIENQVKFAT
uniref:Reverse transcriptase domain-containing protein n=1 Tax=Tanacetum cinerariifolium TaxID=118510 RepID=A0A699K703_TANCI|nr:reverse transcriptase domain-containing protein [Tanacetum cinerariifolium]